MISNDDKHLMMIEPQKPCEMPINDEITKMAKEIMTRAKTGELQYKGVHFCKCGQVSDNNDYILPSGRITNSLILHYIEFHRSEVPESEIVKLRAEYD